MHRATYIKSTSSQKPNPCPIILKVLVTLIAMLYLIFALADQARAGKYDTDAWGEKFRYGAFSTLISSYLMGTEFRDLMTALDNDKDANYNNREFIEKRILELKARYLKISDKEIEEILDFAGNDKGLSIYEEERSVIRTKDQNDIFIEGMKKFPEFAPVDNLLTEHGFANNNFQFNVHRTLYNDAFGIPQNSLSGIVNAYVAGIRNVEFDILTTKDNVSVVVHDLISNRITGRYGEPAKYIEDIDYYDFGQEDTKYHVQGTPNNILNPLGTSPSVHETGLMIVQTERVLSIVQKFMPEMTLYLDARNYAPTAIFKLVHDNAGYNKNIVMKIYPFLYNGGYYDVINDYALKYTSGMLEIAAAEILGTNIKILLAIGHAEMEASSVAVRNKIEGLSWQDFAMYKAKLPWNVSMDPSNNLKPRTKDPIFTKQQLEEIEARTFLTFHWAMGLTGITNTVIFQMTAIPSLQNIVYTANDATFNEMNEEPNLQYVLSSAVHDNFIALYGAIKKGGLKLTIERQKGEKIPVSDRIKNIKFGLSDRFPDFAIAGRVANDMPDPGNMVHYNYSMVGTAGKNSNYQARLVRSARAIMARKTEIEKMTDTPVVFCTTDLEVDLRLAFMGLLGQGGLPNDILFRSNGVVKEALYTKTPNEYVIPDWLKSNLPSKIQNTPQIKQTYTEIADLDKKRAATEKVTNDLKRMVYMNEGLYDVETLRILNPMDPQIVSPVDLKVTQVYDHYKSKLQEYEKNLLELMDKLKAMRTDFFQNYKIKYVTERQLQYGQ